MRSSVHIFPSSSRFLATKKVSFSRSGASEFRTKRWPMNLTYRFWCGRHIGNSQLHWHIRGSTGVWTGAKRPVWPQHHPCNARPSAAAMGMSASVYVHGG